MACSGPVMLPCPASLSQDLRSCHVLCMECSSLRYCVPDSLISFRSLLRCHLKRKAFSGHTIQTNIQPPRVGCYSPYTRARVQFIVVYLLIIRLKCQFDENRGFALFAITLKVRTYHAGPPPPKKKRRRRKISRQPYQRTRQGGLGGRDSSGADQIE